MNTLSMLSDKANGATIWWGALTRAELNEVGIEYSFLSDCSARHMPLTFRRLTSQTRSERARLAQKMYKKGSVFSTNDMYDECITLDRGSQECFNCRKVDRKCNMTMVHD